MMVVLSEPGRHEEALKNLDAVLSASPDLAPALLMRGVVRRATGDKDGQRDIRSALAAYLRSSGSTRDSASSWADRGRPR